MNGKMLEDKFTRKNLTFSANLVSKFVVVVYFFFDNYQLQCLYLSIVEMFRKKEREKNGS